MKFLDQKLSSPTVSGLLHNSGANLPHHRMCTRAPHPKSLYTKRGIVARVEYFLILHASAELASLLAPLDEVDKLDGARVSEQVKSQTRGKPLLHGIKVMPSGLFPLPRQTSTASRAAGTPPDTKAQRIVSLTAACRGIWPPLRLHDKPCVSKHPHFPHKHKYVQQQWGNPDTSQE